MNLRDYLIETFQYNDYANKMVLAHIKELPDKEEAIKLFSHLINAQNKWLRRIELYPQASELDWWLPVYAPEDLESKWDDSLQQWLNYLENLSEQELYEEKKFVGYDGANWSVPLKDIPLQLNYHSIHHRAQIQTIIRKQGREPDFVDYIGTKYTRLY